jgi:hypothetical protein
MVGLLAGVATHNTVVGVVAAVGASVVGWYLIRGGEKVLEHGLIAGVAAIRKWIAGSDRGRGE